MPKSQKKLKDQLNSLREKNFKAQLDSLKKDLKTHAESLAKEIKSHAMNYAANYYNNDHKQAINHPQVFNSMKQISTYMDNYLEKKSLDNNYETTLKNVSVYDMKLRNGFVNNLLALKINTLNEKLSEFDRTRKLINHIETSDRHKLISTDYNALMNEDPKSYKAYDDRFDPTPLSSFSPYRPEIKTKNYDVHTTSSNAFSKIFKRIRSLFSCKPLLLKEDLTTRLNKKLRDLNKNKTEKNVAKQSALYSLNKLVGMFVNGKLNGNELKVETEKLKNLIINNSSNPNDPEAFRAFRKSVTLDFFDKVIKMGEMYDTSKFEPSNNLQDESNKETNYRM